jgi:hypothetical protein
MWVQEGGHDGCNTEALNRIWRGYNPVTPRANTMKGKLMNPAEILQWLGCATGVLGSALLAWKSQWSGWGFVVYLVSNACWVSFGVVTNAPGLVVMQLIFTGTSSIGIWRWLVLPRLEARAKKTNATITPA